MAKFERNATSRLIVEMIFSNWLQHGGSLDAHQIAYQTGFTLATVRRYVESDPALIESRVGRHARKVYSPSDDFLRLVVLTLKKHAHTPRTPKRSECWDCGATLDEPGSCAHCGASPLPAIAP